MSNNVNGLNVRFIADVPPATTFIVHSSELKRAFVNKSRMTFLNHQGQDYFAKACDPTEEATWLAAWQDQADIKYSDPGDYLVNIVTGEETLIDLNAPSPIRNCYKYSWDKSGLPVGTLVNMTYKDCECNIQGVAGAVEDLLDPFVVCSYDLPAVTAGVITYIEPCTAGDYSAY